jgi:hypothetical protein
LIEYLIPPKHTATAQGERVFSLTLMSKGEKRVWVRVPWLPSMPKGEIVGMFYRQCMLVIDGKNNNNDGKCTGKYNKR